MRVWTVTRVTRRVKELIDSDDELGDLWIEGEVSNFQQASSGHCYFTLKDSDCEIRCVMWRQLAARLRSLPNQGDWVEAHGKVSVYERGGAYQFYADALHTGGVGRRWQEYLELKERLEREGLFESDRKAPLPVWPRRIGVVTSGTSAAFRDILNVISARYPLVEVVLSPTLVQGIDAPSHIVAAIRLLEAEPGIDVIVVARGGGSMEDLWAFNDEAVARAVADCRIPVVTGVGHETDFTIVDFCSDYRAPTPSAAAAAVVPDRVELRVQVLSSVEAMTSLMEDLIAGWRDKLAADERLLRLYDPSARVAQLKQSVDDLLQRAKSAFLHGTALRRSRVQGLASSLSAMNPDLVLSRGYAIVQDRVSGSVVRRVEQASEGQQVLIQISDGQLGATVEDIVDSGSF